MPPGGVAGQGDEGNVGLLRSRSPVLNYTQMTPTQNLEFIMDHGPLNRAQLWSLASELRVAYLLAMFELVEQMGTDALVEQREALAAAWLPDPQAREDP